MDEAECLFRLKKAGYQNITLILVDPSEKTACAAMDLARMNIEEGLEVIYFNSLENYALAAERDPQKHRANVLSFVDLQSLTPEGCEYDPRDVKNHRNNLTQHSFHFLRDKGLIHPNTVISFTETDMISCGIFTNNEELCTLANASYCKSM